jgi:hypothetical protein
LTIARRRLFASIAIVKFSVFRRDHRQPRRVARRVNGSLTFLTPLTVIVSGHGSRKSRMMNFDEALLWRGARDADRIDIHGPTMTPKFYKWTVEFEVSADWVADGFNLTDERARQMIAGDLEWAREDELKAKVIKAPKASAIAKEQGYGSAAKR